MATITSLKIIAVKSDALLEAFAVRPTAEAACPATTATDTKTHYPFLVFHLLKFL